MRSFLRLFGPGILKGCDVLFGVAREFNEVSGTTHHRHLVKSDTPPQKINTSKMLQGHYDFVFDWHERPSTNRILELIKLVDESLIGVARYQIFTFADASFDEAPRPIESEFKVSYLKLIGPSITKAIFALQDQFSMERINRHNVTEGISDYYFEWNIEPSMNDIYDLIKRVDTIVTPENTINYKITTLLPTLSNELLVEAQLAAYSNFPYF